MSGGANRSWKWPVQFLGLDSRTIGTVCFYLCECKIPIFHCLSSILFSSGIEPAASALRWCDDVMNVGSSHCVSSQIMSSLPRKTLVIKVRSAGLGRKHQEPQKHQFNSSTVYMMPKCTDVTIPPNPLDRYRFFTYSVVFERLKWTKTAAE